jgi:CheY-like chemotaxis protein
MSHRVLVVEDEVLIRANIATFLRSENYDVDVAVDLEDAVSRVRSKTYHVAVIDIMLAGPDRKNRDGLKVVEEIRSMEEGTLAIVVSQQEDPQVAADTLQGEHVYRYISKVKIEQEGLDVLGAVVRKAADSARLNLFGSAVRPGDKVCTPLTALDYVGGIGPEMLVASNNWANLLGRKVFPREVEDAIAGFLPSWAPLLPEIGAKEYLGMNREPACLVGTFWSKVSSCAVTLIICANDGVESVLSGAVTPECSRANEIVLGARYVKRGLTGLVFRRAGLSRAEFLPKTQPRAGTAAGLVNW